MKAMLFLYLVTFCLQLIKHRVESITIAMAIAPKQNLAAFKLQLLSTKKLKSNRMRKYNTLYSFILTHIILQLIRL